MTKFEAASLLMSSAALLVSVVAASFQYQSRQDSIEERVRVEMKATLNSSVLSPGDLRIISGVDERKALRAGILVTNTGNTTIRVLEVGNQDLDQPRHAFYSEPAKAKVISPGEQAFFPIKDVFQVKSQLTTNIYLGEDRKGKVFAVTTKTRFEESAVVAVAQ